MTLPAIERARLFSQATLQQLGEAIPTLVPEGAVVVACGSFARLEASQASDFDYFTILPTSPAPAVPASGAPLWQRNLRAAVSDIVRTEPAQDGAFGTVESRHMMVRNIGGQEDGNAKLTRRMLFLLEGVALTGRPAFEKLRRAILLRYVEASSNDDPLAHFLLDDIIRYYRTIAVDYEFKTTEGDRPKPWGLRNVKLLFSRRLLYASGLFSVAAANDPNPQARLEQLAALFALPPIERMRHLCGDREIEGVLGFYDHFLERLETAAVRQHLEGLSRAQRNDPLFRELEAQGQRFAHALLGLLGRTFAPTHPIHRALIF